MAEKREAEEPADDVIKPSQATLERQIKKCVESGGTMAAVVEKYDPYSEMCPFSLGFEILRTDGTVILSNKQQVCCEFAGEEKSTTMEEDPKTTWYYRPCLYEFARNP